MLLKAVLRLFSQVIKHAVAVDSAHHCTRDGIFAGDEYKVFTGAGYCGVEQFAA